MIRFTALLAVIGAALVGVASIGAAPAATKKLTGTVGPSQTISLKKGSSRVSTIRGAVTRSSSVTARRSTTSISADRSAR